jgi:ATP-dependent helicase/DNAse subunit B
LARKFVISPTKLRIFAACEAKYRLEYIDKIGKFYHRSRAGFAFGNSLHRALDLFHNSGGVEAVPAEELTASLEQLWVAKGYTGEEQEAEYRAEGMRILQEYHASQQAALTESAANEEAPPPPVVLFTEKTLRIDLSPDVSLSGRIDRVTNTMMGRLRSWTTSPAGKVFPRRTSPGRWH